MNRNRVEKIIDYVKGSPITMDYGRWGALNPEQRQCIKDLCKSWLVLDEAANIQTKEIERLNNRINQTLDYIQNAKGKDINYIATLLLGYPVEIEEKRKQVLEILKGSDKE